MKRQYIPLIAVFLAVLLSTYLTTGCTNEALLTENEGTHPASNILLSISAGVQESTITRADDPAGDGLNANGSWISNFTLFLFAQNAADGDKALLVKSETNIPNRKPSPQEFTSQELSEKGIKIGSHVHIYAIANHSLTNPENMTKKEVIETTSTLPSYIKSGGKYPNVPMSGSLDYEIKSEANQAITIRMHRSIIRLDVKIVDAEFDQTKYDNNKYHWYIKTVKFYNDNADTYLWDAGIPASPTLRTEDKAIVMNLDEYPDKATYDMGGLYMNCNKNSDQPLRMKIYGGRGNSVNSPFPVEQDFVYEIDLKPITGSFIFERNTRIDLTITLKAGSAEISAESLPWDGQTDSSQDVDPTLLAPLSNCYLIKPNETIYIPVAQLEKVRATTLGSTIPAIAPSELLTAELVWSDVQGSKSAPFLAELIAKGTGPYAALKVTTGARQGNAVVAVKGENGEIKWSWHLWVTDYDPDEPDMTNVIGGKTFMDRSLGQMYNKFVDKDLGTMGLHYQWGRKDPFPGPYQWTSDMPDPKVGAYDADGNLIHPTKKFDNQTIHLSLAYSVKDPFNYMATTSATYSDEVTTEMWGGGISFDVYTGKTVFDPCPPGWRVPAMKELGALSGQFLPATEDSNKGTSTDLDWGTKPVYFPMGGRMLSSLPLQITVMGYTQHWSATSATDFTKNPVLYTEKTTHGDQGGATVAMYVRCSRE